MTVRSRLPRPRRESPAPAGLGREGEPQARLRGALGACGLACTAALWLLGQLSTPHPVVMGILFLASVALGVSLALAPGAARGRAARRLAGLICLLGSGLFLSVLFRVPEGEVPIARLAPAVADRPRAGRAAGTRGLRLVDFNVLHGYPGLRDQEARARRLVSALRDLDPDVVVLQEAWWTARHGQLARRLAADLDMGVVYARANGSRRLIGFEEGSAVLSRLEILSARRVVLSPRRPFWQTRIALIVRLALGEDGLTVVGTHLGGRTPELAAAQTRDLASRLPASEVLLVVAGDFNAGSDSAAARTLAGRGLVDLVPGGIDHVFVTGTPAAWQVIAADWTLRPGDLPTLPSGAAPLSDHPGIVVDLAARELAIR